MRLSESLATSHETRAAEARKLSRHWSTDGGMARNTTVTDATALIECHSRERSGDHPGEHLRILAGIRWADCKFLADLTAIPAGFDRES